ncbi:MAG: ribonuclease E/G, partial [Selenomonadaceae bacterium]|nr:ribonuclease E/G [Selenomonadaceae bacterium]
MKSIVVNVMPEETRMAIVDGRELIGLELERPKHSHLVGNIYKGVVQNVLPGMQAAFVDIGKSKNAFLFVGDGTAEGKGGKRQKIHVGQSLPVQITKDEVGTKGPRATLHLTLPGRYVVLMPHSAYIGTSHRIASEEERSRLYDIAQKACPKGMGIILRTVAEGQPAEIIQQDINYLVKLWASIEAKFKVVHGENLLYRDADLVIRIVRDIFNEEIGEMV